MSDEQIELGIAIPDKMYFRIGEVAELVGVEAHVLRYWESEFGMKPKRSKSGQRRYQRHDITEFLRIRQLVHEEGFTIAGARKALEDSDPPAPVDADKLAEVAERLTAARQRIRALRERLARALEAPGIAGD